MQQIKISVIVPVYNVEQYVERCLDSICRQKYDALEIIVVNDCSTDSSLELCEQYALRDSRIKVIQHQTNQGLAAARNTGMKNATGDYYLFVDSDDWIDEHLCQDAVEALTENAGMIDTVHWGYECVDMENTIISKEVPILYPQKIIVPPMIFDQFINTLVVSMQDLQDWFSSGKSYYDAVHSKKQMGSVWRYLFSARVIADNKLQFKNEVKTGQDVVFMIAYLQVCKGIVNINSEHTYFYLQRPGSLIHDRYNVDRKIAIIEAMEETTQYAPEDKKEELRNKWRGQRILVVMNTARRMVKVQGFKKGYNDFRTVAKHPIMEDAVARLDIGNIPFKYKVAIGMLQKKWYFLFYFLIYLMKLLHIDMAPMD